jgi:hypothetical protein
MLSLEQPFKLLSHFPFQTFPTRILFGAALATTLNK